MNINTLETSPKIVNTLQKDHGIIGKLLQIFFQHSFQLLYIENHYVAIESITPSIQFNT